MGRTHRTGAISETEQAGKEMLKKGLKKDPLIRNHARRRAPITSQRELVEKDKCPCVKILNPHVNQDTWQKEIKKIRGERHPFPRDERPVGHKTFPNIPV